MEKNLQKQNFAPVFHKALACITPYTIKNCFGVSGLCLFNVDNVNFNKISDTKALKTIQEKIGHEKTT